MSIFSKHNDEIIELLSKGLSNREIARQILPEQTSGLRKHVALIKNNTGILNACQNVGVDPKTVPMLWLKNKNESVRITNPLFEKLSEEEKNIKDIDFLNIFKDKIKPITLKPNENFQPVALFDRLVYTDVHVGMNVTV